MNIEISAPRPVRIRLKPLLAQGGHGGGDCRCWMILGLNRHFSYCHNSPKRKEPKN